LPKPKAGWLAPGARRHVVTLLHGVEPHADALTKRWRARLRVPREAAAALVAITPASAARLASLEVFFPEVERAGGELARRGVTPERATEALRDFDDLVTGVLDGRFQPAREQLQLATQFALYRGFYAEREAEVRRLESLARHAEEQERRRLGRELHDEAGQSLLLLRLQLEMLERDAPPRLRPELARARATTERIVVELRRIVAALSPAVLERLGLAAAIRQMAVRVGAACGAEVTLRIRGQVARLPLAVQEVVYRIAQEALQNAAKHARANRINLSLDSTDKRVRLCVVDNGAGFAVEAARPTGFGLRGMRERASLLGGTLEVRSSPGQGTSILLRLPAYPIGASDVQNSRTPD
jgi:signal transduction histidine kinase